MRHGISWRIPICLLSATRSTETMALMIPLYVGFIWTSLVSALVILSPQPVLNPNAEPNSVSELSRNISAHTETNVSLLSLPSGGVLSNTSHLNFSGPPYIFCDKALGEDLNVRMCEDALAHATIGRDTHLRTWGPRDANRFDIGLPRLYMSCRVLFFYQLQT